MDAALKTNILFTCAGRRHYLIDFFQKNKPEGAKIVGADMQRSAPALAAADASYTVPSVDEADYLDEIVKICLKEKIGAIISLNDLELPKLAEHRGMFSLHGVTVIVPELDVVDICFDKWRTIEFAGSIGIRCPKTCLTLADARDELENGQLSLPVVLKPRWGSASIGIEFCETIEELELATDLVKRKLGRSILGSVSKKDVGHAILIQQKLAGKEFGLDVLNDFKGNVAAVYVKEKLAMRAGETDKAVLRDHPALRRLGEQIGRGLGHIGNLDCDVFEWDGEFHLLEMNPRFGGGYPFSHMAGANFPAAIYAWLEGKEPDPSCFEFHYDKAFAKCDMLVEVPV